MNLRVIWGLQVHTIKADLSPAEAAVAYEAELRESVKPAVEGGEWPSIDLVLLGMVSE